ncbi:MAG: hypothetical protein P4L57_16380 [Rhizomicrobium sp.]|nr:hypothetical protein [Rhizomicrobium sp.]
MVDETFRPFDSMRIALPLVLLLTLAPATAQSVTVDSTGITNDGQVVIDPGTGRPRVLPPLLQPWQFRGVTLHAPHKAAKAETATADTAPLAEAAPAPRKHHTPKPVETATSDTALAPEAAPAPRKHHAAKPVATATADTAPEAAPAPPKHHTAAPVAEAPKPRRTASVTPPPAAAPPSSGSGFSGFGDLETLTAAPPLRATAPVAKAAPAAPKPASVVAKAAPPKAAAPVEVAKPKPEQHASLEPSKPRVSAGKARDSIAFAPNASDPSGAAVGSVRALAGSLANALGDANMRVQLMAYAGQRGEKSSDTRRLSLKRALVVRQLLIDDGIPAERIDVFALGGVDDSGPLDRVDVLVKG